MACSPIPGHRYLSRKVYVKDESGCVETHPLSIVTIDETCGPCIEPFTREIAGVEYTDFSIECHFSEGRWSFAFIQA